MITFSSVWTSANGRWKVKGRDVASVLLSVQTVPKFILPDWGDKVNYGIGVVVPALHSYVHRLPGRYENPVPESNISPSQGL